MIVIVLSPSMMMMMLFFGLKCRAYQRQQKERAPCHLVTSLPSRPYRHEKPGHQEDDDECAICLETYHEDDWIRTLPCRHEFHVNCVDTWLTTRKKFVGG